MGLVTWIQAGARAALTAAALLLSLHAAAGPVRLDGLRIAGHDAVDPAVQRFTAGKEDARLDLCVMNADGTGVHEVTGEGDEPAFSPDGESLVFTRKMDLYIVNLDGTGLHRLTDTHAWESGPRWVLVK